MVQPILPQQITTYLHENLDHYLDLLQEIVAINSLTVNQAGVNEVGRLNIAMFKELGFMAELVAADNPEYGQHVVLTRLGHSTRKVAFVSHLDTVFSAEEEAQNNFHWRREGDRIYGPGTMDIKGGTVVIYMVLSALQQFAPTVFEEFTWVILINASEEILAHDFGELCQKHLAENALACLVFEAGTIASGKEMPIVVARKGMAQFQLKTEGKSAHAGNQHKIGVNAIVQMAELIQRVAALTDYERDLTFNVGLVSGGTTINRVPHFAEAFVEMRVYNPAVFAEAKRNIMALTETNTLRSFAGGYGSKIMIEPLKECIPWGRNEGSDKLLAIWQAAGELMGAQVTPEARGGLSDGNWIWPHVPTIDGLGPAGANAHCSEQTADGQKEQEYALASSFVPRATLSTLGILKLVGAI